MPTVHVSKLSSVALGWAVAKAQGHQWRLLGPAAEHYSDDEPTGARWKGLTWGARA